MRTSEGKPSIPPVLQLLHHQGHASLVHCVGAVCFSLHLSASSHIKMLSDVNGAAARSLSHFLLTDETNRKSNESEASSAHI